MIKLLKKWWLSTAVFTKIALSISIVVGILVSTLYITLTISQYHNMDNSYRQRLTQVGETIANDEKVIETVRSKKLSEDIVNYAHHLEKLNDLDYIVIFSSDLTRYTHPNHQLIGKPYQGDDDYHEALNGQITTNVGNGTMGRSIRAYVPIIDPNTKRVIGVVSLGTMVDAYYRNIYQSVVFGALILIIVLILGCIFSYFISKAIKKSMLGMEPIDIARVLQERNAMVENSFDGILASGDGRVIVKNHYISEHFNLNVGDVLTDKLPEFDSINYGTSVQKIFYRNWLISKSPILMKNDIIGDFYIIRDVEEIEQSIQSLHSATKYGQAIRSYHHDYLNRLHVIYGLNELGNYEQLKVYLDQLLNEEVNDINAILVLVANVNVAGVLLEMSENFKTEGIKFKLYISGEISNTMTVAQTMKWRQMVNRLYNYLISSGVSKVSAKLIETKKSLIITFTVDVNLMNVWKEDNILVADRLIVYYQSYEKDVPSDVSSSTN